MDSMNYFLNNVNRTIGESMRFARQFQANQQAASSASSGSTMNMEQMTNALNPMIMLMLFQMMSRLMGQPGTELPSGYSPPPASQTPIVNNTAPLQNPAYQFINQTITGNRVPPNINFQDNISIQYRLDEILSSSPNPMALDLSNQLKTVSPDSPQAEQIRGQLRNVLAQENRSEAQIAEFDVLWQAMQANHRLTQLGILSAGNPNDEITAEIEEKETLRDQLALQWGQLFQAGSTSGPELSAKVREALQKGQFTESQLGQSLKYLLDKGPAQTTEAITTVIADLMESGTLNITPFLQNEYLEKLPAERRDALLRAVESSGLRMADGKPNSRFIGFILENISRPGTSATKAFLQQFLQDFQAVHGGTPETPVGTLLADIIRLTGIQTDENGQLIFSSAG